MIAMHDEPRTVAFDARALQADWDRQGLFAQIRALRAAGREMGEPGLLAGMVITIAPFIIATLLIVALGGAAA